MGALDEFFTFRPSFTRLKYQMKMVNPMLAAGIVALLFFSYRAVGPKRSCRLPPEQWDFGQTKVYPGGIFAAKPGVLLAQGEAFLNGRFFRNGTH
jgi:hypothetical protein